MTTRTPTPPPLDDALEALLRRMRLLHIRRAAPEVLATAKAQRWDPAEVLRVLLVEEVAGRTGPRWPPAGPGRRSPRGRPSRPGTRRPPRSPRRPRPRYAPWNGSAARKTWWSAAGRHRQDVPARGAGQAAVEAGRHVAWFTLEALGVLVRRHRADDSVTKAIT